MVDATGAVVGIIAEWREWLGHDYGPPSFEVAHNPDLRPMEASGAPKTLPASRPRSTRCAYIFSRSILMRSESRGLGAEGIGESKGCSGERGRKALVKLAPDTQGADKLAQKIKDHVRESYAAYAYPRELEFVNDLPKTLTGKIRRIELRNAELDRKKS